MPVPNATAEDSGVILSVVVSPTEVIAGSRLSRSHSINSLCEPQQRVGGSLAGGSLLPKVSVPSTVQAGVVLVFADAPCQPQCFVQRRSAWTLTVPFCSSCRTKVLSCWCWMQRASWSWGEQRSGCPCLTASTASSLPTEQFPGLRAGPGSGEAAALTPHVWHEGTAFSPA